MIFRRHSDLPLRGDATSRFLPWIIGVMVFLATLSVAGLLLAQDVTERWRSALAGTLTVQVPPPRCPATRAAPCWNPGWAAARSLTNGPCRA